LAGFTAALPLFAENPVGFTTEPASPVSVADRQTLSLIREASDAYDRLRDYEALFLKTEPEPEKEPETEQIFLKFEKPWKIFMSWKNTGKKGLQVVYERGRHDGKLAIHQPGLISALVPVLFLSQDSPWVRQGSASFDIEDAGIGSFIEGFAEDIRHGLSRQRCELRILEAGQDGVSVEAVFPDYGKDHTYAAHRIKAFFDARTHLPLKMELYGTDEVLIGSYAYQDLRIDVGSHNPSFLREINRALEKVYSSDAR